MAYNRATATPNSLHRLRAKEKKRSICWTARRCPLRAGAEGAQNLQTLDPAERSADGARGVLAASKLARSSPSYTGREDWLPHGAARMGGELRRRPPDVRANLLVERSRRAPPPKALKSWRVLRGRHSGAAADAGPGIAASKVKTFASPRSLRRTSRGARRRRNRVAEANAVTLGWMHRPTRRSAEKAAALGPAAACRSSSRWRQGRSIFHDSTKGVSGRGPAEALPKACKAPDSSHDIPARGRLDGRQFVRPRMPWWHGTHGCLPLQRAAVGRAAPGGNRVEAAASRYIPMRKAMPPSWRRGRRVADCERRCGDRSQLRVPPRGGGARRPTRTTAAR